MRPAAVTPEIDPVPGPSWGPLAFEPSGGLLVRAASGVVRVDPLTGAEAPAEGIPAWPGAVTAPEGGPRWLGAFDPGDHVAIHLRFAGETSPHELPAPLATPAPARPGISFDAVPLAWAGAGLEALVSGEPMLVAPDLTLVKRLVPGAPDGGPSASSHAGSPRSPDARSIALATRQGVLVHAPSRWETWRAPELEAGAGSLRACTVSNDAKAVACLRDGTVVVLTRK
jgi:hypothetical protein